MKVEKILEGARHCFIEHDCRGCPYDKGASYSACTDKVGVDTLELINHLQTENDRLVKENESLKNAYEQCAWERDTLLKELGYTRSEAFGLKEE